MKLFVKNMVCIRCKMIVKSVLENLGLHYILVGLGQVEIKEELSGDQHDQLKTELRKYGLELLDDRKAILIERIKNVIIQMVHYEDELPKIKNSEYISERLDYDYTYLANLFSEVTGTTIEHFFLTHKIERVKELLLYDKLSLKEIAYKMNYSSIGHLSNQFRKLTGLTPSFFKHLKRKKLTELENITGKMPLTFKKLKHKSTNALVNV